jgi:hypothetical protein
MIGCLLLLPITGVLAFMSVYLTSLMAYLTAVGTAMGLYFGGLLAYFTAFFMWVLS